MQFFFSKKNKKKEKKKKERNPPNLHLKAHVTELIFWGSSPKLKNLFYPSLVIMIHEKVLYILTLS